MLCPTCPRRTGHEILREFEENHYDDSGYGIGFFNSDQVIRCMGCETVSFRVASSSDVDEDPETGEPLITEKIYPHRLAGRKRMDGTNQLPRKVRNV